MAAERIIKDPKMDRLINLCSYPSQERNVEDILRIVQEEAPNLLNGLASEWRIREEAE